LFVLALGVVAGVGPVRGTDPGLSGMVAAAAEPALAVVAAGPAGVASAASLALTERVRRDPLALPRLALDRYASRVREYRCILYKQERIRGRLGKREKIEVRYRENPYTVYMIWKKNAGQVRRALYMDTPDFVDDRGRKVARVEPAGAVIRLFDSQIDIPIDGKRSREASRRSIDEFGFRAVLELLVHYNLLAERNGVLDYRYSGTGQIDGRPTFVFTRYLPYQGDEGIYPDAKLVIHIDQEWLLPTALYSYADRDGKVLLGSYVFTNVQINPGFTERDFKF